MPVFNGTAGKLIVGDKAYPLSGFACCCDGPVNVINVQLAEDAGLHEHGAITAEQAAQAVLKVELTPEGQELLTQTLDALQKGEYAVTVNWDGDDRVAAAREQFQRSQTEYLMRHLTSAQWWMLKAKCDEMGIAMYAAVRTFVDAMSVVEAAMLPFRNAAIQFGRTVGLGKRPHLTRLRRRKQWRRDG